MKKSWKMKDLAKIFVGYPCVESIPKQVFKNLPSELISKEEIKAKLERRISKLEKDKKKMLSYAYAIEERVFELKGLKKLFRLKKKHEKEAINGSRN